MKKRIPTPPGKYRSSITWTFHGSNKAALRKAVRAIDRRFRDANALAFLPAGVRRLSTRLEWPTAPYSDDA